MKSIYFDCQTDLAESGQQIRSEREREEETNALTALIYAVPAGILAWLIIFLIA